MPANLAPVFDLGAQFFTNQGVVLSGGKIFVYLANTVTPTNTWADSSQTVLNSNPIILSSAGRLTSPIWLTSGVAYKFVLTDSTNAPMGMTLDNVRGIGDYVYGNPPACSVRLNTDLSGTASRSPIIFPGVILDNRSAYDVTTGIYTVQVAGTYLVTLNLNFVASASDQFYADVGSAHFANKLTVAAARDFVSITALNTYAQGETISASAQVSSGTITLRAAPNGGNSRGSNMNIVMLAAQ